MTNIPTELLRTLVLVADVRSFTKAAQTLGVSQPAVSAHIKRLQAILGNELLDRSAPGVNLTEAGQAVLDHARRLLSLNDRILDLAAPHPAAPPLRIGIPGDFGGDLLPTALAEFRRRFPHQRFRVRSDGSDTLLRGLRQGEMDLAVAFTHSGPVIDARHRWTEKVAWIRGAATDCGPADPVPLVSYDEACLLSRLMVQTLEQAGRESEIVFNAASSISIAGAVAAGLGISASVERFVPAETMIWRNPPLPPMPDIECGIFVREGPDCRLLEELADAIARVIRPTAGVPAPDRAGLELAAGRQH